MIKNPIVIFILVTILSIMIMIVGQNEMGKEGNTMITYSKKDKIIETIDDYKKKLITPNIQIGNYDRIADKSNIKNNTYQVDGNIGNYPLNITSRKITCFFYYDPVEIFSRNDSRILYSRTSKDGKIVEQIYYYVHLNNKHKQYICVYYEISNFKDNSFHHTYFTYKNFFRVGCIFYNDKHLNSTGLYRVDLDFTENGFKEDGSNYNFYLYTNNFINKVKGIEAVPDEDGNYPLAPKPNYLKHFTNVTYNENDNFYIDFNCVVFIDNIQQKTSPIQQSLVPQNSLPLPDVPPQQDCTLTTTNFTNEPCKVADDHFVQYDKKISETKVKTEAKNGGKCDLLFHPKFKEQADRIPNFSPDVKYVVSSKTPSWNIEPGDDFYRFQCDTRDCINEGDTLIQYQRCKPEKCNNNDYSEWKYLPGSLKRTRDKKTSVICIGDDKEEESIQNCETKTEKETNCKQHPDDDKNEYSKKITTTITKEASPGGTCVINKNDYSDRDVNDKIISYEHCLPPPPLPQPPPQLPPPSPPVCRYTSDNYEQKQDICDYNDSICEFRDNKFVKKGTLDTNQKPFFIKRDNAQKDCPKEVNSGYGSLQPTCPPENCRDEICKNDETIMKYIDIPDDKMTDTKIKYIQNRIDKLNTGCQYSDRDKIVMVNEVQVDGKAKDPENISCQEKYDKKTYTKKTVMNIKKGDDLLASRILSSEEKNYDDTGCEEFTFTSGMFTNPNSTCYGYYNDVNDENKGIFTFYNIPYNSVPQSSLGIPDKERYFKSQDEKNWFDSQGSSEYEKYKTMNKGSIYNNINEAKEALRKYELEPKNFNFENRDIINGMYIDQDDSKKTRFYYQDGNSINYITTCHDKILPEYVTSTRMSGSWSDYLPFGNNYRFNQ